MGVMINSTAPIRTGLLIHGREDFMRARVIRQVKVRSHGGDPEKLHMNHFTLLIQAAHLVDEFFTVADLDYVFAHTARTNHITLTTQELWAALDNVRQIREEKMQRQWKKAKRRGSGTSITDTNSGAPMEEKDEKEE